MTIVDHILSTPLERSYASNLTMGRHSSAAL